MESSGERRLEGIFNYEENQIEINISEQSQSSILQDSVSFNENAIESNDSTIIDNDNYNYFSCKKCQTTPLIEFMEGDKDNTIFSCECEGQKNIIKKIIDIIEDENYISYCKKYDLNLDTEPAKSHENQYLINLPSEQSETNQILDIIKNALELNNENFTGKNDSFNNLRKFVKILINHYNYSPNYNLIQDIKNIYYLKDIQKTKIISLNELFEKNRNFDEVKIIKINNSNYNNLEKIGNHILNNLIELNLSNNNIDNIKQLTYTNFENLEILNLRNNKLGDDNIKYLKKIKAPKLKELNFENNYFTDYELFYVIQNFLLLEILNLCSNRFYKGFYEKYKNKEECNLSTIEELLLSNGVFSDETIKLLELFKLDNMKTLHLNGNNLTNISFLLKINGNFLEDIYLNNNKIKEIEIEEISHLENLKKIELENNIIPKNKIKELEEYFKVNNI